jgi:hypothetical protein
MTERQWLPSDWQDESIPQPRPTPDAWIVKTEAGGLELRAEDGWEDCVIPLQEGTIVAFDWTENYGRTTVHFSADGTWRSDAPEPTPSPGAELLVAEVGDWESCTPGLNDFCKSHQGFSGHRDEDVLVCFYAWSIRATSFIFTNGAFEPLPAVN